MKEIDISELCDEIDTYENSYIEGIMGSKTYSYEFDKMNSEDMIRCQEEIYNGNTKDYDGGLYE